MTERIRRVVVPTRLCPKLFFYGLTIIELMFLAIGVYYTASIDNTNAPPEAFKSSNKIAMLMCTAAFTIKVFYEALRVAGPEEDINPIRYIISKSDINTAISHDVGKRMGENAV